MSTNLLTNVLIVLGFILANGVFSMSELAIVSARKVRLEQAARKGDRKAQAALNLANKPSRFFSTVQVGITLITLLSGALGQETFGKIMTLGLGQVPPLAPYVPRVAPILATILLTYLTLVLGELLPKQLATIMPETIAKLVAAPMGRLSKFASPIVVILNGSTKALTKLLGIKPSNEPSITEEEIRAFIQQGTQEGTLEAAEQEIVERVFRLGDRRVNEIMTPRPEVLWLDVEESADKNREKIAKASYRRMPVCKGELDKVIGLVNTNDLLGRSLNQQPLDLTTDLEQPLVVPEGMRSLRILERFKQSRVHTALVVDEYGVVQGLVTLGDILEALVGDVPSLNEAAETEAQQREDGSWLMDGLMDVDAALALVGAADDPEQRGSYQTLGGFVVNQLGRVPQAADTFEWKNLTFEVMDMDGNRVDKILVRLIK